LLHYQQQKTVNIKSKRNLSMKAIIIARVSTEEQKEAGLSLPAQIARLENYCQNKGFPII
jgi:predicted site-specific integrase-resolvase